MQCKHQIWTQPVKLSSISLKECERKSQTITPKGAPTPKVIAKINLTEDTIQHQLPYPLMNDSTRNASTYFDKYRSFRDDFAESESEILADKQKKDWKTDESSKHVFLSWKITLGNTMLIRWFWYLKAGRNHLIKIMTSKNGNEHYEHYEHGIQLWIFDWGLKHLLTIRVLYHD